MTRPPLIPLLAALLLLLTLGSLAVGRVWLPLWGVGASGRLARLILLDLRLPRTLLALAVGFTLGLSGAALQGLTRNPLAEPGLLGVSAGGALGAVIALYFGLDRVAPLAGPALAMGCAAAAAAAAFLLGRTGSRHGGRQGGAGGAVVLVLAGAAVSSLASALLALALNLAPSPYAAYEITQWLLGSVADRGWEDLALATPFMAAGCGLLLLTGRALDALALGEAQAASLGIALDRVFLLTVAGTALAVGAASSVSGAIGFVGLVAPHLVRPLVGHAPARVLIPAGLAGAGLLLGADIAVRLIHVGPELKLGVLTSLVGAPLFFRLVLRLRAAG